MEQTAAGIMSIQFVFWSSRACEPSIHSCSARQYTESARFSRTMFFNYAGCKHSAGTDSQSGIRVVPARYAARIVESSTAFSNGKDLPLDIGVTELRAVPSGGDNNLLTLSSLDSRPSCVNPGKCGDRQAASAAGTSNAITLLGQGGRSSSSFILTAEDSLRNSSNEERNRLDIFSEKYVVLPKTATGASKQLCVAVDVDEVLGSFLATLNLFIEDTYSLHHELSEYHIYDFMKIWNCSQAEANHRVHAFFESNHFKNGISPIPGAHQTLLQLAAYCHLVVVTSRQHIIREPTLEWIERYYGGIFEEVHFGNHFALEGSAKPKSEICRSLGAHVLIDDNPLYALDCAHCGIEVLLFDLHGGYPWSKTPCGPQHPLITRVKDWQEVEQALLARTFADL